MYRVALLKEDEREIKNIEAGFNWAKYGMEVIGGICNYRSFLSTCLLERFPARKAIHHRRVTL